MTALKAWSDNSNICGFSILASVDCRFLTQGKIFLVLGRMSDFLLYPRNLGCYVMRFWILLEFSVLAGPR